MTETYGHIQRSVILLPFQTRDKAGWLICYVGLLSSFFSVSSQEKSSAMTNPSKNTRSVTRILWLSWRQRYTAAFLKKKYFLDFVGMWHFYGILLSLRIRLADSPPSSAQEGIRKVFMYLKFSSLKRPQRPRSPHPLLPRRVARQHPQPLPPPRPARRAPEREPPQRKRWKSNRPRPQIWPHTGRNKLRVCVLYCHFTLKLAPNSWRLPPPAEDLRGQQAPT